VVGLCRVASDSGADLSAIAIPATAQTFGFPGWAPEACLPVGNALYRLAPPGAPADYTVRIDPAASAPDVRIHLAESPDEADFVLVDDGEAPHGCAGAAIRSVKIDAATECARPGGRPDR
jgi:hypothetical protein